MTVGGIFSAEPQKKEKDTPPLVITVLHEPSECEPFLVVDKPSGLPSAPLREGDDSALTQAMSLFPEIAAVHGKKAVERGLIHRIDTATRGCVLIATSQASYDFLSDAQAEGRFIKSYLAKVDRLSAESYDGFPPPPLDYGKIALGKPFVVESRFRGYGKKGREVRPVTFQSGMAALKKSDTTLYRTEITLQDTKTALCRISAGYRHQVRCHLAWLGLPVKNDVLYNPLCKDRAEGVLSFSAISLEFPLPMTGEPYAIRLEK